MLPIICLLVSSCDGKTNNGASSMPSPISAPIFSPSPSPTVVPTPFVYFSASDFTHDRPFDAAGLRIIVDRSAGTSALEVRVDPEARTIGFDFAVATQTYIARYLGESITAATQAVGDPRYDQFTGSNSEFRRGPLIIGASATGVLVGSTYVGSVSWNDNNGAGQFDLGTRSTVRRLLFGARTSFGDLPISGTSMFNGQSSISSSGGGGGGNASFVLDFAARTITGTTVFEPASTGGTGSAGRPMPTPETINFTGSLDPFTGHVSGIATHVLSGAAGKFEGALYGPAASEAAMLFVIQRPDNGYYYGSVAGRR